MLGGAFTFFGYNPLIIVTFEFQQGNTPKSVPVGVGVEIVVRERLDLLLVVTAKSYIAFSVLISSCNSNERCMIRLKY